MNIELTLGFINERYSETLLLDVGQDWNGVLVDAEPNSHAFCQSVGCCCCYCCCCVISSQLVSSSEKEEEGDDDDDDE